MTPFIFFFAPFIFEFAPCIWRNDVEFDIFIIAPRKCRFAVKSVTFPAFFTLSVSSKASEIIHCGTVDISYHHNNMGAGLEVAKLHFSALVRELLNIFSKHTIYTAPTCVNFLWKK